MTSAERHQLHAWNLIIMRLDALMVSSHGDRASVICDDGFRLQIGFDPEDVKKRNEVSHLNVFLQADAMRERWSYARNPARGRFFGVHVYDLVELIWQHGGVDLKRSREATKALKRRSSKKWEE